jgi:hypothetical protein
MRVFVQRPCAFIFLAVAAGLSGRALAQAETQGAAEPPDEVTVTGQKTTAQYRLELDRARDEIFKIFNEANTDDDTDIRCQKEQATGSRTRQNVCRSNAENRADAGAASDFLRSLFVTTGSFMSYTRAGTGAAPSGGPQVNANVGTGAAQGAGQVGGADALGKFEAEWRRLLGENRDLYRAVAHYAELEDEYNRARGQTTGAPLDGDLTVVIEAPTQGPQCEASTLTEYQQRNNAARVTGTVSLSMCPAGTTGSFTLVARVRDDAGEIKPIEFNETWTRADAGDHTFNTDYPIGDNVELMSVRVRNLKCTCAAAAQ